MNKLTQRAAFIAATLFLTGCENGSDTARWWLSINPFDSGWTALSIAFMTILVHTLLTKGKEPNGIKAIIGFGASLVVVLFAGIAGADPMWVALATGLPALSWMTYVEIADRKKSKKSTRTSLKSLVQKDPDQLEVATTASSCGHQNRKGYKFCGSCGKPPASNSSSTQTRPLKKRRGRGILDL